ncbi:MAG: SWIM zinc finger family protein, partial [Acidimicrobiales bacterium]
MTPPRGESRVLALKRFGATWWGKAWIKALEGRARLDPNRLPRGRTYARQSRVGELSVKPGEVTAGVSGSRPTPYIVRLGVRTLSETEWDALLDVIASRAGHAAALLDGELDPGVADDAAAAGADLLPGPGDLTTRCSCPDWAEPCKHAAAVCYLVADVLDADPFALLLLRGRRR